MIEIDTDLKDIVIQALRYAIGRRTYVTLSTCGYIMGNPKLIDERVKKVMLNDLKNVDEYYETKDVDLEIFKNFEKWLKGVEV